MIELAQNGLNVSGGLALGSPLLAQLVSTSVYGIPAQVVTLAGAALILLVGWLLAKIIGGLVRKQVERLNLDRRIGSLAGPETAERSDLAQLVGQITSWIIILLACVAALNVFGLTTVAQPLNALLSKIFDYLPQLGSAILIGVIGWFLAKVVRSLVTTFVALAGIDRLGERVGLSRATTGQPLSAVLGTVAYIFILIPIAIAALQALKIEAISVPAASMLQQVLNTIPQIFTAGLVIALGYYVGKFVGDLVTSLLTGVGFNNILFWLGLQTTRPMPPLPREVGEVVGDQPGQSEFTARTPSEVAGVVVLVGILLFSIVAATNILNIPALTAIVSALLVLFGQVLAGLLVFAAGLYLANLAYGVVASSGSAQSKILGQTARIAIIALVAAMALQQIGVAPNIVNLAFGLLLGAISVAIALAFGLGGRDVASEQLREWLNSFRAAKDKH